ncbi:MAG: hypothetical protein KAG61_11550 [Bacteriovoracaceae bacterium]|nr:hypothetical protein [Bacteriovoracaceae bacterium]
MKDKPVCRNCKHYFVTWDPQSPNGCKAFGFRGKSIPCIAVKRESGNDCMKFTAKQSRTQKGLDLNDDKLW